MSELVEGQGVLGLTVGNCARVVYGARTPEGSRIRLKSGRGLPRSSNEASGHAYLDLELVVGTLSAWKDTHSYTARSPKGTGLGVYRSMVYGLELAGPTGIRVPKLARAGIKPGTAFLLPI